MAKDQKRQVLKKAMKRIVSDREVRKMIKQGKRPGKEEDVSDHFRDHRY